MTISITKMKVINISHLLDIPPPKLMILIGDEFYNRFDSLESMVEFANSNEVFIQCVFIDDIKSVPDFSSVKSDYVIQPYFIKVVDKSKNNIELLRSEFLRILNFSMMKSIPLPSAVSPFKEFRLVN